ncbi:amidohydrolase [Thioclava sp. A2]|uniref:amidohydrolase family protein n=1 Tax=Thioclava sp. FCG-A2 TaxID=3080562 RepID=UPI0029542B82|nr:amidohydrolase [Thioclava sp. A2]MDV7272177.1 amidohydrolase [Thioclava sp. A2]
MLIDTHLHLIDRDRIAYPWLKDVPPLDRDWSYDAYEAEARRLGIGATLHMEVDCAPHDIGKETAWIAELMRRPDSLIKGAISSARPESEGFGAFLDGLDLAVVRGIRRVLHVVPDEVSQGARFRANIRKLGQAGLPFDICVLARQLPLAAALADSCEGTEFVLDHCGVPDIAGEGFDDWARDITKLAKRPNVSAKISGISAYAAPDWTLDTLRPYAEHIIASFGWSRVVWGSDSPVCTLNASLSQWVAATRALFSEASDAERRALFSGNARRIWSL